MQWTDEAVVLGVRRHGETAAIAELLTRQRGRHLGLVRGGRSRKLRPVLQPGNLVEATWRARLEEQLGTYAVEPLRLGAAALIDDPLKLAALSTLTGLIQVLPEREPHQRLYDALLLVLAALEDDRVWPALLVRFELGLLDELGFGLDLARCAATGSNDDLAFVSPRTGRAVSRSAGEPYHDRLLRLPAFLRGEPDPGPTADEVRQGFALTGHFLAHHLFEPRGLATPERRAFLVAELGRR